MIKPLEENYIRSLREWANGVISDQVVTTPHSAARVALELLDHIQFLKDTASINELENDDYVAYNNRGSDYIVVEE